MNADQFKEIQKSLDLKNGELAKALDVSLSSITKYRAGTQPVPKSVQMAMEFMAIQQCSCPACQARIGHGDQRKAS